jgi:peptidoglycan/LPS O-acetylase OafA/YrhL
MIKPLTSLRFFAAFAVVLAHMNVDHNLGGPGVMFFFVLSGFILAFNYAEKFVSPTAVGVARFYALRAARIFPMHIVCFLAAIPIGLYEGAHYSAARTVATVTLLNSWVPGQPFTYNWVAWTLSVEWFFYLATPLLIFGAHKAGITKTWARSILAALVTAGAMYGVLALVWPRAGDPKTVAWWFLFISPYFHFFTYAAGAFLGLWFLHSRHFRGGSVLLFTLLELAALAGVAWSYMKVAGYQAPTHLMFPFFCLTVVVFAFGRGYVSKVLSISPFVLLGEISFSIYMVHQLLIRAVCNHIVWVTEPLGTLDVQLPFVLLILVVSYLGYVLVETPARRAAGRIFDRLARAKQQRAVGLLEHASYSVSREKPL